LGKYSGTHFQTFKTLITITDAYKVYKGHYVIVTYISFRHLLWIVTMLCTCRDCNSRDELHSNTFSVKS